jgi:hypothetical protein
MPRLVTGNETKTEDIRVGDWWYCGLWHYPCQVIDYLGNDKWLVDPHHKGRVKMYSGAFHRISPRPWI